MFAKSVFGKSAKVTAIYLTAPVKSSASRGILTYVNRITPATFAKSKSISARSVVTIDEAKKAPSTYADLPFDILMMMSSSNDQKANEERLIRNIMSVDGIEHADAEKILYKIKESNRRGLGLACLPYYAGVTTALVAGFGSIPMIFDINTVMWFNELYVTSDVPEAKDLETPLEVGGWAWNWMEPPLGQISFFLLCLQYSRAQLENLGIKPYTQWYRTRRSSRVCKEFKQYSEDLIDRFSVNDPFHYDD